LPSLASARRRIDAQNVIELGLSLQVRPTVPHACWS
jgi:hypothetical protein